MCWFSAFVYLVTRCAWMSAQPARLNMSVCSVSSRAHPSVPPFWDSSSCCGTGLIIQRFFFTLIRISSVQFSSFTQLCPTLCDPMNCSTPGLPVHHQLPEFTQTHVHRVSDAIQPSHPLSFPSPPAPNPSQHQNLFRWVNSLNEVAKVLEFQL